MKNNQSPQRLSIITTISLLLVNIVIYTIFSLLYDQMHIWTYILGFLTSFIFSYFIIYQTLETFIYKKIKLIYKTIHRLKRGRKSSDKSFDLQTDLDLLENVNKEFIDWANSQKNEIKQMKELEQYRRNFVGNVSHELKTPIFNIQGYIHTLLDGGIHDDNINVKYLEKTSKSVDRMINMVEDLETISALESGIIEMNFTKFNIIDLTQEVIEFLEVKAQNKNINLFASIDESKTAVFVFADKVRIRQIIINLIDNAIKYTSDTNSPYIKVSFYDMDENILIEVSDNGLGISMENIPHLFDRFYRVDSARSRAQGGTGLGLSIVKHIIEAHKQTINVRSNLGVGTTFSFTLKKS
ncbi:MAG: two-component sensor histidine kinase [Bacteroidetes bacterium 4572_112]|nr:MAG: two-component sensor histidine kinase [Bacteroidetes bacterium 4572_112]